MKAVIPAEHHEDVFYNNALRCYKKSKAFYDAVTQRVLKGEMT